MDLNNGMPEQLNNGMPEQSGGGKNKKPLVLAGVVVAALALGAVAFAVLPKAFNTAQAPGATSSPGTGEEPTSTGVPYTTQEVTFTVLDGWTQVDGTDYFLNETGKEAYGLNGVSALGSQTPQDFFEELVELYETEFTDLEASEELTSWTSDDGVVCQTADFTGYQGEVLYCTKLVIAPQKNMVLTYFGQAGKNYVEDASVLWSSLNTMCESITFERGNQDYISGNTFLAGDGSQLCLQDDGSYLYYRSEDDHENQYYEGTYEVYYGQAAMDKVVSMTEYGLTEEELDQVLAESMNGYIPGGSSPADFLYAEGLLEDDRERYTVCLDTFYAVILHNQNLVNSPGDVEEVNQSTLYIGYYLPELEQADLTNCNAQSHAEWTFQQKTA